MNIEQEMYEGFRSLGLLPTATRDDVGRAFRSRAKQAHPDHGGSSTAFQELVASRDRALKDIKVREILERTSAQNFYAKMDAEPNVSSPKTTRYRYPKGFGPDTERSKYRKQSFAPKRASPRRARTASPERESPVGFEVFAEQTSFAIQAVMSVYDDAQFRGRSASFSMVGHLHVLNLRRITDPTGYDAFLRARGIRRTKRTHPETALVKAFMDAGDAAKRRPTVTMWAGMVRAALIAGVVGDAEVVVQWLNKPETMIPGGPSLSGTRKCSAILKNDRERGKAAAGSTQET